MTPGYCPKCMKELQYSSIIEEKTAWCAHCRQVVRMMRVPKWVVGVLFVLIAVNVAALWHF